jgi:hypothetical protein
MDTRDDSVHLTTLLSCGSEISNRCHAYWGHHMIVDVSSIVAGFTRCLRRLLVGASRSNPRCRSEFSVQTHLDAFVEKSLKRPTRHRSACLARTRHCLGSIPCVYCIEEDRQKQPISSSSLPSENSIGRPQLLISEQMRSRSKESIARAVIHGSYCVVWFR